MTGRRGDRGAASVEFVLLIPVLLLVLGLVAGGARLWYARATVTRVADSAARAASLARDPVGAAADARAVVASDLASAPFTCADGVAVVVDTAGFAVPVGQPARVGVRVGCGVALSDLSVPGIPGVWFVEGVATSTLDRHRGRG